MNRDRVGFARANAPPESFTVAIFGAKRQSA
jgi:hypothetical protein